MAGVVSIAVRRADERFHDLYARHAAQIGRYLAGMVGESDAEDLAQETFIKAYRALDDLPADANAQAWLYRIAHNTAIDRIRRRRLVSWLPLVGEIFHATTPDIAEAVVTRDRVKAALAKLTPEQRGALLLREVGGLSYEEIAAALGVSLGTVKMRLLRARDAFRAAYGGEEA